MSDGIQNARDYWNREPRVLFEHFRDRCIGLIEMVADIHHEAMRLETIQKDFSYLGAVGHWKNNLRLSLVDAKEIWWATPISRYLTRDSPIIVDAQSAQRCRYDGACYHEVAINFADGAYTWSHNTSLLNCSDYTAHLRFYTARGQFVTDYLKSLVADIRCECHEGIDKWRLDVGPQLSHKTHQPAGEVSPRTRACSKRDHLWLQWYNEIGANAPNVFGQIRDRWNALSESERSEFKPCNSKLTRGRTGYDTVRKAIQKMAENSGFRHFPPLSFP